MSYVAGSFFEDGWVENWLKLSRIRPTRRTAANRTSGSSQLELTQTIQKLIDN